MNKASVLVTGASGMLGSALVRAWRSRYRVVAASKSQVIRGHDTIAGDFALPGAAEQLVQLTKPDFVVHAAAWTDVDSCEVNPALAMQVNSEGTGRLATASQRVGAAFAYISTESVFDGKRGNYRETDRPNPINQYAASKLAGESRALSAHPHALVLRIGLEGWRPSGRPGFVQWIIEGLRRGVARTVCTDWIHTLIFATNVAEVLERLWEVGASGIYHAGADQPASNWEIAQQAAARFDLDALLLVPIHSDKLRLRTPRPRDVSLVSDRLRETIGPVVWHLSRGLDEMRLEENAGEWTNAAIR